jgi:hypothetical protein
MSLLTKLHAWARPWMSYSPHYRAVHFVPRYFSSSTGGLDSKSIEERVLNVLKSFDKVDPSKVS